jgi:hypothetical protein
VLLSALLIVTAAVDIFMMVQPALVERWSHAFRSALSLHPVISPATHVLASTLAVASIVSSSAGAIFVVRAVRAAPHVTVAPVWISLCMLSAARVERPLPLPMSTPLFIVVTAMLFIAASTLLRSGSRLGGLLGWGCLSAPIAVFAVPYLTAPGAIPSGAAAWTFVVALVLSASGAIGSAFVRSRVEGQREVEGLEGVDLVNELFAQVERAERSEARVAELEQKLRAYVSPAAGQTNQRMR